jgi:hypothetical protein
MNGSYEILVEGVPAQDLFFVEREVHEAKVVEQPTEAGKTSFGMPGLIEAAILVGTSGAVAATLAWIFRQRTTGKLKVRRRADPKGAVREEIDLEWDETKSSDKAIETAQKWMAGSSGAVGGE